jgi:hypothetical protein
MSRDEVQARRAIGNVEHSVKLKGSCAEPTVHVCVGCGIGSPVVATNYTVITSRYGWRLTQREHAAMSSPRSSAVVEWRCPGCWAQHTR